MLNMIKMDLYRMFRTKSMYVVWIVLAVSVLFTTFMCKIDYDSLSKEDTVRQEQLAEPTAENINVGMMVTLPTEPGEKVTVYDIFFANSQGKFYALFLVIFAVMFSKYWRSGSKKRSTDFFQIHCIGGLYDADNGRSILAPGSCELYSIQRIDVGKFKSCSVLFPDGAGPSLCTRVDLHGDCNYSEK